MASLWCVYLPDGVMISGPAAEISLFRVQPRSSPSFAFASQTPQLQGLITHQIMQITFSYSCRFLSWLPSRHTYLHCTSCVADKYISSALQ